MLKCNKLQKMSHLYITPLCRVRVRVRVSARVSIRHTIRVRARVMVTCPTHLGTTML